MFLKFFGHYGNFIQLFGSVAGAILDIIEFYGYVGRRRFYGLPPSTEFKTPSPSCGSSGDVWKRHRHLSTEGHFIRSAAIATGSSGSTGICLRTSLTLQDHQFDRETTTALTTARIRTRAFPHEGLDTPPPSEADHDAGGTQEMEETPYGCHLRVYVTYGCLPCATSTTSWYHGT